MSTDFSMQSVRSTSPHAQPWGAVRTGTTDVPAVKLIWILRILSTLGLAGSAYLAYVAFTAGKVAGCGAGNVFDCGHVLTSRWSTFFGMPVSLPAVVLYASVLGLLFVPTSLRRLAKLRWFLISFALMTAGLGAMWFIGLQIFSVGHLCAYCLGVHLCGITAALLIAWQAPAGRRATNRLALLATAPVALFISGQLLMPEPEKFELIEYPAATTPVTPAVESFDAPLEATQEPAVELFESPLSYRPSPVLPAMNWAGLFSPMTLLVGQVGTPTQPQQSENASATTTAEPEQRRTATILNGLALDVKQWPLLGQPEAKYVFVEMLDYTCHHCQNTHPAVHGAREKYGDQLAVVILPVPMHAACNRHVKVTSPQHAEACDLAKVAIAVWRADATKFETFHNWLLEAKPRYNQAYTQAGQLVGDQALKQEMDSGVPAKYIAKNVELYERAAGGAIPKILFPKTSAVGEMRSSSTLISLIEQQLGR